jgi:acetyl-CoA acetyltransferase
VSVRGHVAIAGIGHTAQGEHPGLTADDLAVDAAKAALADAGLDLAAIDGLVTCVTLDGAGQDREIGRLLGLNPRYSASLTYGTCNFSLHLATMAIISGMATTVLLTYGANQRTGGTNFARATERADFEEPHGFVHIAGAAALAFQRHRHLYGTTEAQLGAIAVAQRRWAQLNPLAIFREPLSIDDYLAAPYLVRPLRRADVTMISDGGVAVVLTASDRATAGPRAPAYVRAIAQTAALRESQNPDNYLRPWLRPVAERVFASAGVDRADVDVAYFQDPTSVWVLQMLEHYGFCGPGEAGPFVAEGRTAPGGELPINTNGGQLSESYMWGWLHVCEAVRQLRGECGPRQVPDAHIALHASTGAFFKGAATILGREP